MKVLLLGFVLPEDRFGEFMRRESGMPTQTQRFGASLVEALTLGSADVEVVSAAPATDFPHHRRMIFRKRSGTVRGSRATELPFVNLTGLKHLTRFFAAQVTLARPRMRADAIVVHGVHSPFLWAALFAARRWKCPLVVVLTDPPSVVTPYDNRAAVVMKRVDRRLISSALRRVTGVVTLTRQLAEALAPDVPALHMEGIVAPSPAPSRLPADPPQVVYAGGLHESYGVSALLDAVECSVGDWELHLYGRGPLQAVIEERASEQTRVHFHGLVGAEELHEAYERASLVVNPRPVDHEIVSYSFPSKLLEYLGTGRPVMTTRLPTIPTDYFAHVVVAPDDPSGMAREIDEFLRRPAGQRVAHGLATREFVVATRSAQAQGRRLVDFISSLVLPDTVSSEGRQ